MLATEALRRASVDGIQSGSEQVNFRRDTGQPEQGTGTERRTSNKPRQLGNRRLGSSKRYGRRRRRSDIGCMEFLDETQKGADGSKTRQGVVRTCRSMHFQGRAGGRYERVSLTLGCIAGETRAVCCGQVVIATYLRTPAAEPSPTNSRSGRVNLCEPLAALTVPGFSWIVPAAVVAPAASDWTAAVCDRRLLLARLSRCGV